MSQSDTDSETDDTLEMRANENRLKLWILLRANRWIVTGALLGVVFVGLIMWAELVFVHPRRPVVSGDPIETAFQALIAGIITSVTFVVTISQLVLSQELGPLGDQRQRMEGEMDFREDVEDTIPAAISPVEPSAFLRALVESTQERANALKDSVDDNNDQQLREQVDVYVDTLTENAREVSDQIEDAEFGTFDVLWATLDFDYAWGIYTARRIRIEHADSLSDGATEILDDLVEVIAFFGPAREHFKTLYFRWELINLSRKIMYSSIPALIVALSMTFFFDPSTVSGTVFGINTLALVVSATSTITLIPFILLIAYILRIATIAKQTASIGPFILRETDQKDEIDWQE